MPRSGPSKTADMRKENAAAAKLEECGVRMTRARAKTLGTLGGQIQKPSRGEQKRAIRTSCKRVSSDQNKPKIAVGNSVQNKRRAVLSDVTNVKSKLGMRGPAIKNSKVGPSVSDEIPDNVDVKEKIAEDITESIVEAKDVISTLKGKMAGETSELTRPVILEEDLPIQSGGSGGIRKCFVATRMLVEQSSRRPSQLESLLKKDHLPCEKSGTSNDPDVIDIDSKHKDPQMCSLYALDIYYHIRVTELNQRSSTNYMETVQRDITQSMRGILIDWLVEVSEEYKLVPDTLYLTVNLIDRFLSQNYIEKQRLQLLGVSCMLIASKYEEMCAPRVEEFCFITDNTYTKEEVLKMESRVLNFMCFQLSVPTTKTFLRRFVQAAQATYEVPSFDLEFLANYLAELTLIEYSFLKYLPSLIAASAVFLARWTLDQSDHPWNPTLEHYTCYKAPDLKVTVIAMQDLQINAIGCPLNAIRGKYTQQKFHCVANLSSSKPVQSLF
ncbi:Cyclin-A2 [Ancistrocladus abbreviatus]